MKMDLSKNKPNNMKSDNIKRLRHISGVRKAIHSSKLAEYAGIPRQRLDYMFQNAEKFKYDPCIEKIINGLESDGIKLIPKIIDENIKKDEDN